MEQMADVAPMVQILDALVPQMVEHVVDVLKIFDRGLAEQVIEVPKVTLQEPWSVGCSWRNSWWTCPCQSRSSWHMAGAILA